MKNALFQFVSNKKKLYCQQVLGVFLYPPVGTNKFTYNKWLGGGAMVGPLWTPFMKIVSQFKIQFGK